jgi:hypothetical protein
MSEKKQVKRKKDRERVIGKNREWPIEGRERQDSQ